MEIELDAEIIFCRLIELKGMNIQADFTTDLLRIQ
jgi:hypothetical protein